MWHSAHISPLLRVALLLGVLVHLAGFFFFRVISSPLPTSEDSPAFISFMSSESDDGETDLIEQASLFDTAPLFIPGEWSTAAGVFTAEIAQDWQAFPGYEPDIDLLSDVRPSRLSLPKVAKVEQPGDLLDLNFWDLFSSFGQRDSAAAEVEPWKIVALATRVNQAKGAAVQDGIVLRGELETEAAGLNPLICYMNLSAPGLMTGAPVIDQSTGSIVLDEQILNWLTSPAALAKLPAGLVELRVFP